MFKKTSEEISSKEKEPKKRKVFFFNIKKGEFQEKPEGLNLNEDQIEKLLIIEESRFGEAGLGDLASDREDLLEGLESSGIQIIFKEDNEIVGYISSKSAEEAKKNFDEVRRLYPGIGLNDAEFKGDENTLYIESIAGKIGHSNYKKIMERIEKEAKSQGYKRICFHLTNPRLEVALKSLGFEKRRKIDDWYMGADAVYMEKILN